MIEILFVILFLYIVIYFVDYPKKQTYNPEIIHPASIIPSV